MEHISSPGDIQTRDIAATAGGGAVVVGRFYLPITFGAGGPNPVQVAGAFQDDGFIVKYGPDGVPEWAAVAKAGLDVVVDAVAVGVDGRIAITGSHRAEVSFEPSATGTPVVAQHRGSFDQFMAVLNPDGEFLWSASIGGGDADFAAGVAITPDGAVYVTGSFGRELGSVGPDVDGTIWTSSNTDVGGFLARFQPDGRLEWVREIGGDETETAVDVLLGADDVAVAFGKASGSLVVATNATDSEEIATDMSKNLHYLLAYSETGDLVWWQAPGLPDVASFPRACAGNGQRVIYTADNDVGAVFGRGAAAVTLDGEAQAVHSVAYGGEGVFEYLRYIGSGTSALSVLGFDLSQTGATAASGFVTGASEFTRTDGTIEAVAFEAATPYTATFAPAGGLQCLWTHENPNIGRLDEVSAVAFDDNNGVWVAGKFQDSLSIDDGMGGAILIESGDGYDIFVAHYRLEARP